MSTFGSFLGSVAAAVLLLPSGAGGLVVPTAAAHDAVASAAGAAPDAAATGPASPVGSGDGDNEEGSPYIIPLRRESVPVTRKGKVVSFRTSYSGLVSVGSPKRQDFRVVFDTGSGHLVLPSAECPSESCLVHRRYNQSASASALAINADGSLVQPGKPCDQVNIGFGTGKVKGEFVRETMCLSGATALDKPAATGDAADAPTTDAEVEAGGPCITMNVVMAIEMSTLPFKNFGFDGILGMGLSALSLSPEFSFFNLLSESAHEFKLKAKHFSVFLTEGDDGEESEIAIGGHNPKRSLTPLSWTPVALPELGYWQVQIVALRIGGKLIDICGDGTCRGVLDTGTSHLGVPAPYDAEVARMLTTPAGPILDCRLVDLPEVQIELPGINITLHPDTYMRRLPLREDVNVDSARGVSLDTPVGAVSAPPPLVVQQPHTQDEKKPGSSEDVQRFCRPRLMPVSMPEPLGPKLFILGEPVLHRYYTVFDWEKRQVGLSLAANARNLGGRMDAVDKVGSLPKDMDVYLMQQSVETRTKVGNGHDDFETESDSFAAMQMVVEVTLRLELVRPAAF